MNAISASYSLDLKIKDTRFSIDNLQDYSLLLQAGEREFQLAVIDTKTSRCLLLEQYNFNKVSSAQEYQKLIESLFEDHHLLMAGFWHSVKFSVKNSFFSLIPAALFDKEQLPTYLRLTTPQLALNRPLYYKHLKNSIVTVFAAEQALLDWLNKRYANLKVQVLHHISAFVEGILHNPDHSSQREIFLLLENGILSVVITHETKLQYASVFRCGTPADLLRYLMMVIQHFQLDQHTTKIQLWGNVDASSAWFKEIQPYFGNLSFGGRPRYLSFGYVFDEVPEARFYDLLSQHLCE
ncbi:DUF3822 family protein [Cesiribacter sp. SM1]|uniref:DUF3822 family protein n=1 Tax=Cesiribacter sp. SM1 TaxID=2861196 RepID=UPI001CD2D4FE|nr:DUF3822 family protein [Cesiribacter sp. SM1]